MAKKKTPPQKTLEDGGEAYLAKTVQNIARGEFSAVEDLYALPGMEGVAPRVANLAEAMGLILVK